VRKKSHSITREMGGGWGLSQISVFKKGEGKEETGEPYANSFPKGGGGQERAVADRTRQTVELVPMRRKKEGCDWKPCLDL